MGEKQKFSKICNNTIRLSCHEKVCLTGQRLERYRPDHGRSLPENVAHLNVLVHDVINLLYYEYWTDRQVKIFLHILKNLSNFFLGRVKFSEYFSEISSFGLLWN